MSILNNLESRASGIKNPAKWLKNALTMGGGPTPAGVNVTHDKALGITAFWNGVRIISQTRASIPMQVFERTQDGNGREIRRDHQVHKLLNVRPNPWMTPYTFKEIRAAHELTFGNSYAEIEKDRAGRPVALWPLLPDRTDVEVRDGQKWFWTLVNGQKVFLAPDRVLHVPGLGFDGLKGYNVIKVHRDSLGLSLAANQYGAEFFGNSGRPSGVITHPGKPSSEERQELREQWNQVHSGLTNAQRTAILWGGMEWQKVSMNPEEAQFLQTRVTQIDEVARILNINPILLQQTQGATTWGTAIGQFLVAYAKFTITPWVEREEDVINYDLFRDRDRGNLFVKGNVNQIMRGDPQQQAQVNEIKRRNGVLNADEWRALDEQNPMPDGQGQVYTLPLNFQNVRSLVPEDESTEQSLQESVLSGTQIQSLVNIIMQIAAGQIPPESAKEAMKAAFPSLEDEQIDTIVDNAENFDQEDIQGEAENIIQQAGVRQTAETRQKTETRALAARMRLREANMPVMEDGARRIVRRETQAMRRAIKRAFESDDPADSLNRWIEDFYPKHRNAVIETMKPIVSTVAANVAAQAFDEVGSEPEDIDEFVDEFAAGLATREIGASKGQIRTIIDESEPDQMRGNLENRADEWEAGRPEKTAMRETVAVATGATRAAWQKAGVTKMVWRTSGGACPICQQMEGAVASITSRFVAAGESVNAPDRAPLVVDNDIVSPPLHQGCDCDIVPG